ncbi:TetR/AcrR family transcriptional regulator [Limnoraphis robusta Tam1]|uniref:TetR/AcrR family transcriptional regulator n=1 Tax=Limnoraphis robusta CCNP1315 TaxID=3110306 RepID=A0ABU5U7U8_9CYAN|nr:TetR/AcrR family transcriptional regulator [Limnoraphis robusta]MEA5522927.1 TetR/AcrR family transcriptional regulator [Limnoraphis robusta CCNP1315]MEA5541693.1 TetR/AcrR family transcriptional regulator [Limnoraphis robusta Tam1]MEA5548679.1 TetR/AcrR family transcriptional regulator [Limnoraphis robusta CCNP1324]
MKILNHSPQLESETSARILKAAQRLFARKGYDGTTTRDLAQAAGVAEGTIFRHFPNKKAILIEVATEGWIEILTDLLTELSEMGSYKAVAQVMRRRMLNLHENADLMRVCFLEAQFHPELRDRIQSEVIAKMTDVAEAFFETAMEKGVYRRMNPRIVAQVFLGMFAVAGFSYTTLVEPGARPKAMQELAEGLADIFLNGVLNTEESAS